MSENHDYQKEKFSVLIKKAKKLLGDESRLREFACVAQTWLKKGENIPLVGDYIGDIVSMIDLLNDYIDGNYRDIPKRILLAILAVLIYLVSPVNLIPDFLPIIGYLDNMALISLALSTGADAELQKYRKWRRRREAEQKTAQKTAQSDWKKEGIVPEFIACLPKSVTDIETQESIRKLQKIFPVPDDFHILWAEVHKKERSSYGILLAREGLLLKSPQKKEEEKERYQWSSFLYLTWEEFSKDSYVVHSDYRKKETYGIFDRKELLAEFYTKDLYRSLRMWKKEIKSLEICGRMHACQYYRRKIAQAEHTSEMISAAAFINGASTGTFWAGIAAEGKLRNRKISVRLLGMGAATMAAVALETTAKGIYGMTAENEQMLAAKFVNAVVIQLCLEYQITKIECEKLLKILKENKEQLLALQETWMNVVKRYGEVRLGLLPYFEQVTGNRREKEEKPEEKPKE